ncbi:MAG: hypothetical protein AB2A00_04815 [Myxococcota bacterium]
MEAVRREFQPRGVEFMALSLHPVADEVVRAASKHGVGSTVALARGEVLGPLGLRVVPATVFVDAKGVMVASAEGERSEAFFRRRVKALLAE